MPVANAQVLYQNGSIRCGNVTIIRQLEHKPILVIASGNIQKVTEITLMLEAAGVEVQAKSEGLEIEETGHNYAANARLKAETVASISGHWALADDSGIEVDALDGRPGLYSARYASTDSGRISKLLQELGNHPYRSASFVSCMALANSLGQTVLESDGICKGSILLEPQGQGTGFDSIFFVREANSSYAQMTQHQRSRLGSRGKAARRMAPKLRQLLQL